MNLSFRCSSLATSVNEAAVSGLSRFCWNTQEQRAAAETLQFSCAHLIYIVMGVLVTEFPAELQNLPFCG